MRAELKSISMDDADIKLYAPENPEIFFVTIRLRIGLIGAAGGDYFELFVCTAPWIERNVLGPHWGRHLLIVKEFNYQAIVERITSYISQCEGLSWTEVASKLARFFAWEFEDYEE